VFSRQCLATADSSSSVIPAFSHYVTAFISNEDETPKEFIFN
jgi:hypothetical protein